jgi:hypothetical protein
LNREVATPAGVVTETGTGPGVLAGGENAVIAVSESMTKEAAGTAPKETPEAPEKSLPVIVTSVRPVTGPFTEARYAIAGGGWMSALNPRTSPSPSAGLRSFLS